MIRVGAYGSPEDCCVGWQGAKFDVELHDLAKKLRKVTPPGSCLSCSVPAPPVSPPRNTREQRAVGAAAVAALRCAIWGKQKQLSLTAGDSPCRSTTRSGRRSAG